MAAADLAVAGSGSRDTRSWEPEGVVAGMESDERVRGDAAPSGEPLMDMGFLHVIAPGFAALRSP
ncbi:MAG TPA: hypothetical protein VFA20_10275, partial [Myxococcaceae bacterium]|nr:hypothetical protein [Myxococcaceae bacterium]